MGKLNYENLSNNSSARKDGSTSRALAKKLLDKIKKPDDEVIYRDLNDEMVFVSNLSQSQG